MDQPGGSCSASAGSVLPPEDGAEGATDTTDVPISPSILIGGRPWPRQG